MPTHNNGYDTCHYVLGLSDDSILGRYSTCVWKDSLTFIITLDISTSNIKPTDNLRTKTHVVDKWGVFTQGINEYFKVNAPLLIVPIQADINGPNIVGQCAKFILSSVSIGVKDASQSVWNILSPQPIGLQTIYNGNTLNIDANEFGTYLGDIDISLTVSNWLGSPSTIIYSITRAALDAPIISIAGKTIQIIDTSQEYTLISNAYLASCSGTSIWQMSYKWMQITDHNQIINDGIDISSNILMNTPITYTDILTFDYDSTSSLSIPAFSLKDDKSYLFYVYASNGGDFNDVNTTAFAYVIVTAFDIPLVKTVYQKTIGTNEFNLYYTDLFEFPRGIAPDNTHYQYTWNCIYTKLPTGVDLSSADKNHIHEFGYNFTQCEFNDITGSYLTNDGIFPISDTTPLQLHFGEFTMIPNSVYIITLQISDNNAYFLPKTSSVSLFTKPVQLPEITIISTTSTMNPHDHAVIKVKVSPYDAVITWRPSDISSNLLPSDLYSLSYIAIKQEIDFDNNEMISNLVLNPDFDLDIDKTKLCNDDSISFESGKDYSFTIWARNYNKPNIIDYYASTNVIITINSAPTGGKCSVTPTTGRSVDDKFEFSCSNWYDPDGDSEKLTYNFMYNNVFLGEDFSTSSYLSSVIGGNDVTMTAYIKDEAGLNTCYDIPVYIIPRFGTETETEIAEIISGDMQSISAFLLSQSIANTLQSTLAVAQMIRELSGVYNNGNFTKVLNEYKNSLMEYVMQSQGNSAQSINSALQHIQTINAMLKEEELDGEDSYFINFGTADGLLLWIEDILENYQKSSTSDSDVLLPPMLSLLEKIQEKALNDHIADALDGYNVNRTKHLLQNTIDITMSTFTYGLQQRVLGELITHDTPILNGFAMKTGINAFNFGCPSMGPQLNFPNSFFDGFRKDIETASCGIIRMPSHYYGYNKFISTNIFEFDVLTIDNNGEVTAANPAVSGSFLRRRNRRLRRRMLNDTIINDNNTLTACESITFSMEINDDTRGVFFDDIQPVANKTIYIPECKFYDVETETWSSEGCITLNYTDTTVWCSCTHFTSFAGLAEAFKPQVNIITTKDLRNLNAKNVFEKYPTAFSTLCVLYFITGLLLCFLPNPDDTPLLARADVLQNKLRRAQAMERWKMQRFVRVLQSPMGLTRKLFRLFAYRLQDDHSVLSLFARSEGTNYSTKQRVMILHLYLIVVMAVSALFYGQSTDAPFGDTILAIYASICSTIPVFTIRYMFQYSRPKETKQFVEWESKLLAKKLIALKQQHSKRSNLFRELKQRGRLDLTIADNEKVEEKPSIQIQIQIPIENNSNKTPSDNPEIIIKSPSLQVPNTNKTPIPNSPPTIGHSHRSSQLTNLTYNYEDDEELSESEQNRLMANIFNLERPTQIDMETGVKKSAIFKSPIVVNVNN
eukprot:134987_1